MPDPDFKSYKDESGDTQTTLLNIANKENTFIAAALPLMGDDLQHEVLQSDQCKLDDLLMSLDLEDDQTDYSSYSHDRSIDRASALPSTQSEQLYVQSPADLSWSGIISDPSARCLNTEIDLVYPQLPNPACSSATHLANKLPQPKFKDDGFGYLDDDDPIAKLWLAFERSVQRAPDRLKGPKSQGLNHIFDKHSLKSSSEAAQNTTIKQTPTADIGLCPEINRLTIVPAWLYQHQYLYWPPTSFIKCEPIRPQNIGGAETLEGRAKIEEAVDWVVADLGLSTQHTDNCNRSQTSAASLETEHALSLEDMNTEQNDFAMAVLPFSNLETPSRPVCDDGDEDYSSLYESLSELSEIDADEAAIEWNDWEDFEWDVDIESEDEKVGLFAME